MSRFALDSESIIRLSSLYLFHTNIHKDGGDVLENTTHDVSVLCFTLFLVYIDIPEGWNT